MASRNLGDLHPFVHVLADKFLKECKKQGIDVLIYCTLRDNTEQDSLYAQGRTKKGRIVTNAKGGYSYHNYGLAFDCVPSIDGRARWDRIDLYNKMGRIGRSLGLVWGGDFKSFKDRPHFQWSDGLTIKQLLSGQRPRVPKNPNPTAKAINTLVRHGVISSPDYWITNESWDKKFVELLIQKMANKLEE